MAWPVQVPGSSSSLFREKLLSIVPWEGRGFKSKWSKRVIELNEAAAEIFRKRKETMFSKALPVFANETGEVYAEHSVYHAFKTRWEAASPRDLPSRSR